MNTIKSRTIGVFQKAAVLLGVIILATMAGFYSAEAQASCHLCYLAERNDTDGLRDAIDAGGDVNGVGTNGNTPLLFAINGGHVESVEILLAADGIDVDQANVAGFTPLILAAEKGNVAIVDKLLAEDPLINKDNGAGNTALLCAIIIRNITIVDRLLDKGGVDVNHINNNGSTPLILAVRYGGVEIVNSLLNAEDTVSDINVDYRDRAGKSAVDYASAAGAQKIDIVVALFFAGATLPGAGANAEKTLEYLKNLSDNERAKGLVKAILSSNSPYNAGIAFDGHNSILLWTVDDADALGVYTEGLITVLRKDKVNADTKNGDGNTALESAIKQGGEKKDLVPFLNWKGINILHAYRWALKNSRNGLRNAFREQYETASPGQASANISYRNSKNIYLWLIDEDEALSLDESETLIEALKDDEVLDDKQNDDLNTALESAIAQKKNERIVTALNDPEQNILHTYRYALENKKDGLRNEMRGELAPGTMPSMDRVDIEYRGSESILLHFAKKSDTATEELKEITSIVQALVADGAKLDTVDSDGNSALLWRAKHASDVSGHGAFQSLIDGKADKNLAGNYGFTPLMFVASYSMKELTQDLLSSDKGGTKADVNATSDYGYTALLYAVLSTTSINTKRKDTVNLLLNETGIKVTLAGGDGNTALILAAFLGYHEIADTLLRKVDDTLTFCLHRNNSGRTAVQYADSRSTSSDKHEKTYRVINGHCPHLPGLSPLIEGEEQGELEIDLPPMPNL